MDFGRIPGKFSYSDNSISTMRKNALKAPTKPAVIHEDTVLTWQEFWERSNRLANALIKLGLKKGDRVQIFLPNCLEYPEVVIGGNKAGLINTAGNFRLTGKELSYQLNDCGARAIIMKSTAQYENLKAIRSEVPSLEHVIIIDEHNYEDCHSYYDLINNASHEEPDVDVLPEDVHLLMYTGGTTGYPKGAARTNKCDFHMAIAVCLELGLRSDDIYLAVAPLYAAASMGYMFATLLSGGTVAIATYSPDKVLACVEKYRATWMFMVPVMYEWMLAQPAEILNQADISTLRHIVACGAPLRNQTAIKLCNFFKHAEVSNWLGASEFGFISKYSYKNGIKDEGCVGKPVFDLELTVLDEAGRPVKVGGVGLLYARGFSIWEGYWNKPEATREAYLDHEWATIGDIVRQDEDGDFYIVDRKNDMIITGGTNVYPAEVEKVLLAVPGVKDVAVIGVPDEKWGEAVKAVVVRAPNSDVSEEEIINHCRKELAGFKVPKSVDFVDEIPRSFIGKTLKKELRRKYWEGHSTHI
jgi:long-chain acyl-CoA synthetase